MTDFRMNQVTVGNVLKNVWEFFKKNLVFLLILSIVSSILSYFSDTLRSSYNGIGILLALLLIVVVIPVFKALFEVEIYAASKENRKPSLGNIFGSFRKDIAIIAIKRTLRIFGWTLLLIIPGIYMTYAYDRATYIKYDNPNLSDSECFNVSKRDMDNYKFTLFVSQLPIILVMLAITVPLIVSILNSPQSREIAENMAISQSQLNPYAGISNSDYVKIMFRSSPALSIVSFILITIGSALSICVSPIFQKLRTDEEIISRSR